MRRVGETRVDLHHLLEDLRDAYGGSIEESIVTEIVANALDAGATSIGLSVDAAAAALTIVDDGRGMLRRELARYHDIAASTKRRGEGIGFAGVGIKLGLLVSRDVVTETRRGTTHVATRWSLASRHRAPWKWIPPPGLVAARGTAVRLVLSNPLSPLVDAGFLEETIRRHFEPLLDAVFEPLLRRHYTRSVAITIEGRQVSPAPRSTADVVPVAVRLARKRLPSATGYLARSDAPLPEDRAGIAISTFGKVIKRGWDWLGLSPAAADRVTGLVEVPDLAECLTLNKNDFLRTGPRGATYLAYRKALQEVVSRQLTAWGDARGESSEPQRPARLDRDLARVLEDLAGEFPLLHSLVERRRGGQKRLPMPRRPARWRVRAALRARARGRRARRVRAAAIAGRSARSTRRRRSMPPSPSRTSPRDPTPTRRRSRDRTRRAVAHSTGCHSNSRRVPMMTSSAGWSTARFGSTMRIRRSPAPHGRGRWDITWP